MESCRRTRPASPSSISGGARAAGRWSPPSATRTGSWPWRSASQPAAVAPAGGQRPGAACERAPRPGGAPALAALAGVLALVGGAGWVALPGGPGADWIGLARGRRALRRDERRRPGADPAALRAPLDGRAVGRRLGSTSRRSPSRAVAAIVLGSRGRRSRPVARRGARGAERDGRDRGGRRDADGTLVAAAETVRVEGTVDGDLIVAAARVEVRGTVRGDLVVAAGTVEVGGAVEGSVYAATGALTVRGRVARGVYAAGRAIAVEPGARVGGDLTLAGRDVALGGEMARGVAIFAHEAELCGHVGRDVRFRGARLLVRASARVDGALRAHVARASDVTIDPAGGRGRSRGRRVSPRGPPRGTASRAPGSGWRRASSARRSSAGWRCSSPPGSSWGAPTAFGAGGRPSGGAWRS